jgi:hypothetical protein
MIGPEEQSGFTDSYIRDSLWDNNFDIEDTLLVLAGILVPVSPALVLTLPLLKRCRRIRSLRAKEEVSCGSSF